MTKTFEEELKDREAETFSHWDGCTISKKEFINYADVVNLSEGWVSPEEHQARVNELIEAKEKKIKQLRKINHLYKKSKENAERLAVDRGETLNQAQDELASLESQLQQQALPVVPECVARDIEKLKSFNKDGKNFHIFDLSYYSEESINWVEYDYDNYVKFYLAVATGKYEVEKPQLFYLVNKMTGMYLNIRLDDGTYEESDNKYHHMYRMEFTKQEIDSMQAGSYELVPVEDGE